MKHIIAAAAVAAVFMGSVAFAATTTPAASSTSSTTTTTTPPAPQPPASLHCKAPEVATQVKDKDGKTSWKCAKPAPAPATPATNH